MKKLISKSIKQTIQIAKDFSRQIKPGDTLILRGDLGAGKTTFMKGIAKGFGVKNADEVKSPTYVIMHLYNGKVPIYHFDLYRLGSEGDIENLGFDEFLEDEQAIKCIEWPERSKALLSKAQHSVDLKNRSETEREIILSS